MKYVYFFSKEENEGNKGMKELLGGKGANLAEMSSIGIKVPPGFTISTEACAEYSKNKEYPEGMWEEVKKNVEKLEATTGKKFGDEENPLLVSVRSGAAVSMPGMMDTVLNLGMNDNTAAALAKKNERFAYDSYRRFLQMFGDVVLGIEHYKFDKALQAVKTEKGAKIDTDLTAEDLKEVVELYKKVFEEKGGFPDDPLEQLKLAVNAVFDSWDNERAILYRKINKIFGLKGTAVNVQTMVFGNMGDTCGTGVGFTRNPSTGEKKFFGEFLFNAQGEDVVAGIRTPLEIEDLKEKDEKIYTELMEIAEKLEKHYKDMQDIEFTLENGDLFLLQTRTGKRTAAAAVKTACDMADEGLIDKETAILRVDPNVLDQLLHKQIDPNEKCDTLTKGLPASPGAAVGKIVFNADDAHDAKEKGEKVILVRVETSPEDIKGMVAAQGILTATGGMTSHAAVVARGMGKCCIAGAGEVKINEEAKSMKIGDCEFKEGDVITLNGSTGEVIKGEAKLVDPQIGGDFAKLMAWADEFRKLSVRTNAETPTDCKKALELGAEGIGLARTEHMFFGEDRIKAVREFIVAENVEGRLNALKKIEPIQQKDFEEIFKIMEGKPVNIRLLDPPLHEFLPRTDEEIKEIAGELGINFEVLKSKVESLHEVNPMLGHRGCRLAVTYPELAEMQTRAIINAAINVGHDITPEIMIPLVGHVNEISYLKEVVVKTADKLLQEKGSDMKYKVGTMIEVPRAALTAADIAEHAEFFSFGTNDLTQMTYGFSRDDVAKFVPEYVEKELFKHDPFQVLDQTGVGRLIDICVKDSRAKNENLKIGICGEHGGEPSSVKFCHRAGFNYVSCSPFRIPIAKLAAAQAALEK